MYPQYCGLQRERAPLQRQGHLQLNMQEQKYSGGASTDGERNMSGSLMKRVSKHRIPSFAPGVTAGLPAPAPKPVGRKRRPWQGCPPYCLLPPGQTVRGRGGERMPGEGGEREHGGTPPILREADIGPPPPIYSLPPYNPFLPLFFFGGRAAPERLPVPAP